MSIIKAELLWTRKCNLDCHYCGMATGEGNSVSLDDWKKGIDNLKELDCKFIAFYGAEPLSDFNNLPQVVGYAEQQGIATTIITSGMVSCFKQKLIKLYEHGARSLTMSYDIVPLDEASRIKSQKAMNGIAYFKSLGKVRDVAIVVTLNRLNYMSLIDTIEEMSDRGIWTFFDIIHPDRGQMGSKCKGSGIGYLFDGDDFEKLKNVLDKVKEMKAEGYLCHTSNRFINLIMGHDFDILKNYNWNCACYREFPSWVTIDCDGKVYACDDFQGEGDFHMINLKRDWDKFEEFNREEVLDKCPGCCWNTHIDAHLIKAGVLSIGEYVHGQD